jgi:hypothetical protein
LVLAAVSQNGLALQYATQALRSDRGVVHAAVSNDGLALAYTPLRDSIDIALVAIRSSADAITLTPLRQRQKFMAAAVAVNGLVLKYADDTLRLTRQLCLAAVAQNGLALKYVPETVMGGDDKVQMTAVRQNGLALKYLRDLRSAPSLDDIVFTALEQNGLALSLTPQKYQRSHDAVRIAVSSRGTAIEYADAVLQTNRDLMMTAVESDCRALSILLARHPTRVDADMVLAAALSTKTFVLSPDQVAVRRYQELCQQIEWEWRECLSREALCMGRLLGFSVCNEQSKRIKRIVLSYVGVLASRLTFKPIYQQRLLRFPGLKHLLAALWRPWSWTGGSEQAAARLD